MRFNIYSVFYSQFLINIALTALTAIAAIFRMVLLL